MPERRPPPPTGSPTVTHALLTIADRLVPSNSIDETTHCVTSTGAVFGAGTTALTRLVSETSGAARIANGSRCTTIAPGAIAAKRCVSADACRYGPIVAT